jgi:two-component system, NarL family, invasion response regulator UvrY
MSTDHAGFLTGGRVGRAERGSSVGSAAADWGDETAESGGSTIGDDDIVVSIVEDHPMFRRVLADVVSAAPGMRLGDVGAGLADVRGGYEPGGVVLLDFYTPGVFGVEAVRRLTRAGYRVLVVSASERPDHVLESLDAGAAGYLSKAADADQLVWAIRRVAEGSFYVAPHIASLLLEHRRKAHPAAAMHALTSRERQVLALVAEGLTDQEVAGRLKIGVRTVRSHLDHIRTKTGRRRRAELTRLAIDEGVVEG